MSEVKPHPLMNCQKCGEFRGHGHECRLKPHNPDNLTTEQWKKYKRKGLSEMRPYITGESLDGVSISSPDRRNGSPKIGDMIARNPRNHADQWLVAKEYFEDNLEPAESDEPSEVEKLEQQLAAGELAEAKEQLARLTPKTGEAPCARQCEYQAVQIEMARLKRDLAEAREDVATAAKVFAVAMPEPGSDMAKIMVANQLLRRELTEAREKIHKWQSHSEELVKEVEAATKDVQQIAKHRDQWCACAERFANAVQLSNEIGVHRIVELSNALAEFERLKGDR